MDDGTGNDDVPSASIFDSMGPAPAKPVSYQVRLNGRLRHLLRQSWLGLTGTDNKYVVTGNPVPAHAGDCRSRRRSTTVLSPTYLYGAGGQAKLEDTNGTTLTDSTRTVDRRQPGHHDRIGMPFGRPVMGHAVGYGDRTRLAEQTEQDPVHLGALPWPGSVVSGAGLQVTTMTYDAAGNKTSDQGSGGEHLVPTPTTCSAGRPRTSIRIPGDHGHWLRPDRQRRLLHRTAPAITHQLHLRRSQPQDRRVHRIDHAGHSWHPARDLDLGHPEEGQMLSFRDLRSPAASSYKTGARSATTPRVRLSAAALVMWSSGWAAAGLVRSRTQERRHYTGLMYGGDARPLAAGSPVGVAGPSPTTSSATRSPQNGLRRLRLWRGLDPQ